MNFDYFDWFFQMVLSEGSQCSFLCFLYQKFRPDWLLSDHHFLRDIQHVDLSLGVALKEAGWFIFDDD